METSFDLFKQKLTNKFNKLINLFFNFPSKALSVKIDYEFHIQDFDQTVEYFKTNTILRKAKFKPNVIFYLFQQNFLTAKNIYELNKLTGAPIYWYLMDTAALTGACHYSWDCFGYTKGCGACPALYSNNQNDQSAVNFRFKQEYLSKTDIHIIAPSEWQFKKAAESLLFKDKPIHKVLLSIDSEIYHYLPKKEGKNKLGISTNKKVIFFGSTGINRKRKGMPYFMEALRILENNGCINIADILILAAGNFDLHDSSPAFNYKNLGFLQNSEELAAAYHAADVFVCPSIEDSGPMMINQSIMTGTPVVCFEMGVSEDLVITGVSGYRAKLMNSSDLAKGLSYVLSLNEEEHTDMCTNCRKLALSNYTFNISTEKIITLIQNVGM